ncbi:hypothetical protein MAR_018289 [Mya arenaria]|uniref:C1q domain-containing protein n=1 Tax=Mya arenaria TaxID=6604 RepID=A0ABY7EHQ7_MYAAR|nr:hypothetical protein MAR_018289 [Mya arenaria]
MYLGCRGKGTGFPTFMAVIFDAIMLNQGGGYDNRHDVFRATINGTYMFTATLSVAPQGSYHAAFVKNTADNEIGYLCADPMSIWLERSTTVVTHLAAGEEVWMVCLSDFRIEGNTNYFHAHMCPDRSSGRTQGKGMRRGNIDLYLGM